MNRPLRRATSMFSIDILRRLLEFAHWVPKKKAALSPLYQAKQEAAPPPHEHDWHYWQ